MLARSMRRRLVCAGLLLSSGIAAAQGDPFAARARGLTDYRYPTYQGVECTTIAAPRELVYRVLIGPETAGDWLLADLPMVAFRNAHYRKGPAATKGDALILTADTPQGIRNVELKVLFAVPPRALALAVTKDEEVISPSVDNLTDTFVLEETPDGQTDLWWATHYDPDSPLAAALSGFGGARRYKSRVQAGLLVLKALAETAAAMPAPPLHQAEPASPREPKK
jgi:uncharacterized protein YndB with AHSA1/START domain